VFVTSRPAAVLCDGAAKLVDEAPGGWSPKSGAAAWKGSTLLWTTSASLNGYHNASTPPDPDVPAELAGFMLAADPVLGQAAELARVLVRAQRVESQRRCGIDSRRPRVCFSVNHMVTSPAAIEPETSPSINPLPMREHVEGSA
jgi:hypothetical protein